MIFRQTSLALGVVAGSLILSAQQPPKTHFKIDVISVTNAGVSPAARDLPGPPFEFPAGGSIKKLFRLTPGGSSSSLADTVAQSSPALSSPVSGPGNFEGIDATVNNPLLTPPDENLAVGPNHIVQTVNMAFGVFDKTTGAMAPGFPKAMSSLYQGTGGACETEDNSDPIVRYDRQSDRWLLSYVSFQINFLVMDSHLCVAVSQTPDPTGAYYLYDAGFGARLQDYPHFGLWTDAWFSSANSYPYGISLEGGNMCAWERSKFLAGDTSGKVICVVTGNPVYAGMLPSDWDGANPPPAGSPNYFLQLYSTTNHAMFKFKPNFANPGASVVTGPIYIPVAGFTLPCSGGDCIPQKDTTQLLASLGDRLMYRLTYRNFGGYDALVVNHAVLANGTVGPRWYEIRNPNSNPTVFQQGTYTPDADYRWMASAAMDKFGNIAMGYSKSGPNLFPGIYFAGHEAGVDPLGEMGAEQQIWAGSGSQPDDGSGAGNRWGDYSSLETDPTDDCTFWYTSEYLPATGNFNWRTRIASFKFPACGGPAKLNTTTTITNHSPSVTVTGQQYTVSVAVSPTAATGSVTVNDGLGASCVAALVSGSGACNLTAATAGSRTLTALYGGDSAYNGSVSSSVDHPVNPAATTLTITGDSPDPSNSGEAYSVTFSLTVNSPGAGSPTGNVTVSDGNGGSCVATVAAGGCSLTSNTAGDLTLTATYAGNSNFLGSNGTAPHHVNPVSVGLPAAPTNLNAIAIYTQQGKKSVISAYNLTWTDNATNETQYRVERWNLTGKGKNAACSFQAAFTLGANATGYVDTSASSSTCEYRVAAENSAGTSSFDAVTVP